VTLWWFSWSLVSASEEDPGPNRTPPSLLPTEASTACILLLSCVASPSTRILIRRRDFRSFEVIIGCWASVYGAKLCIEVSCPCFFLTCKRRTRRKKKFLLSGCMEIFSVDFFPPLFDVVLRHPTLSWISVSLIWYCLQLSSGVSSFGFNKENPPEVVLVVCVYYDDCNIRMCSRILHALAV
jgi:hypothetical protein